MALPTRRGQRLELKTGSGSEVVWKALDDKGEEWFSANIDLMGFDVIKTTDEKVAANLREILVAACRENSDFLSKWKKYRVTTQLEFPRHWGLGSSATLINLISQWAEANPYMMYFNLESGSGYDIAASLADEPIFYTYTGEELNIVSAPFDPPFKKDLYFVPLGEKANSAEAVKTFLKKRTKKSDIQRATGLTEAIAGAKSLKNFNTLIEEHEQFIGQILGMPPVKERLFPDYPGAIKSLGAWGGDMILASGNGAFDAEAYFHDKGYDTVLSYDELIVG